MGGWRYGAGGAWWKGNTHIHTTCSDGGRTPAEVAALYAAAGYHFLFRTDHWAAALETGPGEPLLMLPGVELDGRDERGEYFHVVCLGRFPGLARDQGFAAALAAVKARGGLTILAHPRWCGNGLAGALAHGFDGVEVYNHVCHWINAKSDGMAWWDHLLAARPGTLAFAADDSHIRAEGHGGWNGGWIRVLAPACTEEAILAAIARGDFHATQGPEFHRIAVVGGTLELEFSPARMAWLVGPDWRGLRWGIAEGQALTRLSVPLPDWPWCRVELEDEAGRHAWTNTLAAP